MEWIELKQLSEKVRLHLQELKTVLRGNDKGQQQDAGIDDIIKSAINQILYPEGDRHVETEIERREKTLADGELRILIAGEQATGKSSLMNILMGGDYLPTDHFHCTAVLCELHLSSERKACVYFRDTNREPIEINDLSDKANIKTIPDINGTGWERVWYFVKESPDTSDILKVQIFWPIPFIQNLLTLRPTSETHRSRRQDRRDHDRGTSGAVHIPHMCRDSATRMRELKLPDVRYPGDGASRTGSVIEEKKEIQAHCETTNAFPAESSKFQCSDSENVQSMARTLLITESDLSERLSNIEAQRDINSEQSEDTPIYPSISQTPTGTAPPLAHLQEQEILEENESEVNSPAQGESDSNDLNSEETHPKEYYRSIYQLPTDMTPQFQPATAVSGQNVPDEVDLTNSVESSQHPDSTSSTLVCCDEAPEAVNVVFCDCPGITEDEEHSFQTTLENVETAHGIILLTDAFKSNAGIEQNKVIRLLQRIQNQLRWHGTTLQYKPILCVCNKMDMIKNLTTRQTIKEKVQQLVADNFPTTQSISVRLLGEGELIDDQPHSRDLNGELEMYLKQSFILAVEEQYLRTSASLPETILVLKGCCLNSNDFYLIFEDCQFDLATFIKNNPYEKQGVHREKQKKEFTEIGIQIAHGVHYLHDRYVCHGSLKPTNILLKKSEGRHVVKLASVGTAIQQRVFADSDDDRQYRAAELVRQSSLRPSKESDIYSVGLILLELWFRNTVHNMRKRTIESGAIEDKHVRQLICGCLQPDPTKRWAADGVLESFKLAKIRHCPV